MDLPFRHLFHYSLKGLSHLKLELKNMFPIWNAEIRILSILNSKVKTKYSFHFSNYVGKNSLKELMQKIFLDKTDCANI